MMVNFYSKLKLRTTTDESSSFKLTVMEATVSILFIFGHLLYPAGCNTMSSAGGNSGTLIPQRRVDLCESCNGDNSTCRVVSGIYSKPQLNVGYNFIVKVFGCNLNVTELRRASNHLALRRKDGSYIINGDWRLSQTGKYYDAGTAFQYQRQDLKTLESVTSSGGPIQEPLDLMILYQQPHPIIKYEYMLPQQLESSFVSPDSPVIGSHQYLRQSEAATARPNGYVTGRASSSSNSQQHSFPFLQQPQQHPSLPYNSISPFLSVNHNDERLPTPSGNVAYPRESSGVIHNNPHYINQRKNHNNRLPSGGNSVDGSDKTFYWKSFGTNCSEPCGGGIQRPIFRCVRGVTANIVSDRRCSIEEKPISHPVRCNVKPCPAEWIIGEWSRCNVDCGEGHKTRSVQCQQRVSPTLTMQVAEGACLQQKPQSRISCNLRPCNHWRNSEWSQCSARCGSGIRKRSVVCVGSTGQRLEPQECDESDKPPELTPCNMGPCEGVDFFVSEWSSCTQKCGTGVQTRHVVCSSLQPVQSHLNQHSNSYLAYSYSSKNDSSNSPSSDVETNLIDDDDNVDNQFQFPGKLSTDLDASSGRMEQPQCDESKKPAAERECFSERNCGESVWFTGDWSQCSSECGSDGIRTRQVICVIFTRGKFKVTTDNVCASSKKPDEKEKCHADKKCSQRWFTSSEWSECSALCGGGLQKRSVSCRASNYTLPSSLCFDKDRPVERKSCNEQKCTLSPVTVIPTLSSRVISNSGEMVRDKPISFRPYTPSIRPSFPPVSSTSPTFYNRDSSFASHPTDDTANEDADDASCNDQYRNCALVVQARLCRYKYYRSVCCSSCADAVA